VDAYVRTKFQQNATIRGWGGLYRLVLRIEGSDINQLRTVT